MRDIRKEVIAIPFPLPEVHAMFFLLVWSITVEVFKET